MRVEGNHMPLDGLLSDLVHDFFRAGTPPFGDKLSRRWSPHFWIGLYAGRVPADKCALRDLDGATEGGVTGGYAINELGDGGVDAEELNDDCGQVRKGVEGFRSWIADPCCEDFGAEAVLDSL